MIWRDRDIEIKVWKGQKLKQLISIDCETEVKPFHLTPDIITCQAYDGGDTVYYVRISDLYRFFNKHDESTFIFHNAAFDLDVLNKQVDRLPYTLLDDCRARDTSILYRLWHLGHVGFVPHKYSLAMLTEKYLGETLDKNENIRGTFEQFKGKPIEDIPREWLEYGARDVLATFDLYLVLMGMIDRIDDYDTLLSHDIQIKGDLALNHIRKNGIGFDLQMRDTWLEDMNRRLEVASDVLATWGWVRGLKGLQQRYEQAMEYAGIKEHLPRTASGDLSSKSDDLDAFRGNPFVDAYLEFHELEKAMSFVKDLSSDRIHPRYNLLVNTGRTSCSKPNFQQLPRLGGVREMFRARPNHTLIITDYSAIELATLSQVTYDRYGESTMRDKINEGKDLHRYYSSVLFNKAEQDITKDERQKAKAANFGFPGGLGIETFKQFASGYGLELTDSEAQDMKDVWFRAFPEMNPYMQNEVGYVFTRTGRRRANTTYCAEKNTPFQGLAADGAKFALYNLDKEGFRVVGFIHDECIVEVSLEKGDTLVPEVEKIMIDSMASVVPDVKIAVESMVSEVFTK